MIGFIVIGKNESSKLSRCFGSIVAFVKQNNIQKYEIIYVDSDSTDNSIEVAKSFAEIKVFQIKGNVNAALGRNIGASNASSDILVFIDGDMELMPEFYPLAFKNEKELVYKFTSGKFVNWYYDKHGKFIQKEIYQSHKKDRFESTTGGLFIIDKELWDQIGGMNTKFKTGEDLDLGLRLAKKGIPLLRKPQVLANHHTISYKDNSRMWKMLFKGLTTYSRSVLYRQHLLNKYIYVRILKSDMSSILMVLCVILAIFYSKVIILLPYVCFLLLGAYIKKMNRNIIRLLLFFVPYLIIRDLYTVWAFLFFYPKKIENYQVINHN